MNEKRKQASTIRYYRDLARTIVRRYFGKPASRIVYKTSGKTNYVFALNHIEGQFVIRISPDGERINAFKKELWASQKVREAGVPSLEILAVGNDIGSEPYMITRRVTGTEATHHPKRRQIIQEMGRYAAIINSIRTNGFGANFDWTGDVQKNGSWRSYLENEFEIRKRLSIFSRHKILSDETLQRLFRIFDDSKLDHVKASLNHSDLRLKNVIVDESGDIAAIIDWEECLSTIAPQWELSIALHDLSIDEKNAFINGYGLNTRAIEQMSPLIKAFNVINYANTIELAVQKKDRKGLDEIKLRLNGYLDLYSL